MKWTSGKWKNLPIAVTIAIVNPNSSASSVGLPPFAEEQIWSKTLSKPFAKAELPPVRGGGGAGGAGPSEAAAAARMAFCPLAVLLNLPTRFSAVSALRFTDLRLWASAKVGKEAIVCLYPASLCSQASSLSLYRGRRCLPWRLWGVVSSGWSWGGCLW